MWVIILRAIVTRAEAETRVAGEDVLERVQAAYCVQVRAEISGVALHPRSAELVGG